jgi:hypothetical protein
VSWWGTWSAPAELDVADPQDPTLLIARQLTAFVSAEAPEGVASWLTQHQVRYTIWHSVQNGG